MKKEFVDIELIFYTFDDKAILTASSDDFDTSIDDIENW